MAPRISPEEPSSFPKIPGEELLDKYQAKPFPQAMEYFERQVWVEDGLGRHVNRLSCEVKLGEFDPLLVYDWDESKQAWLQVTVVQVNRELQTLDGIDL
jgi:hypothetical protein